MLEKIDERTNLNPILNGPFLLNLCHSKGDKNKLNGPFFVNWTIFTFLLHFPIRLPEISNKASKLHCETLYKISS